MVIMPQVVCN